MATVSLKEKVGYGFGDLGSTIIFATITTFLMYYYTDVFGLSAAAVGGLFFVARMIDAVSDPVMGAIADRTTTRWGKFRPYILFGAIPLGIFAVLTLTTPDMSDSGKLIYAYITYIGLMLCYTIVNIPYSGLPALMSASSEERTQLTSFRMLFAFSAQLVISGATLPLVGALGGDSPQQGFQNTMMIFATIAVCFFFLTFFLTKERIKPVVQSSSLKEDLKVVSRNKAWWILLITGVLIFSFSMLPFGVGMYFFRYNVGNIDQATGFFVSGNLGMIAGVILTAVLSKKICKKQIMFYSQFIGAFLAAGLYFISPENVYLIYGVFFLMMIAMGGCVPIIWSMVADAADYCEWKQGKRVIGLTTSSATFSHKFGMGISGVVSGVVLSATGYQAGAAQTPEALQGIAMMMSLLPAVGFLLIAITIRHFPVDKAVSIEMQKALEKSRAARLQDDESAEDIMTPVTA